MIYRTQISLNMKQIEIIADENAIIAVNICKENKENSNNSNIINPIIEKCKKQLEEYFEKTRIEFDLTLKLQGTDFQKQVWEELLNIPYGKTCSYKEIAIRIGKPKAVRAVANAIGKNPIWIIIPCHRVIGSDGSLTGYAGGLEVKKELLSLEGLEFKD